MHSEDNEIQEFLIRQIKETGIPLEIKTSLDLSQKWDHITNQDTYVDSETNKLREIDISAYSSQIPAQDIEFEPNFVIECKKSEKYAWVFFTQPKPSDFDINEFAGQFLDDLQMATKDVYRSEIRDIVFKNIKLHYDEQRKCAVTFQDFKIGEVKSQFREQQNEINEARQQLKGYIAWAMRQDVDFWKPITPYSIEMYFPCIVFKGRLYEGVVKGDDVSLVEAKHLVFSTLYKSNYSPYERNMLIDVVREDFFESYQELIMQDVRKIAKNIEINADLIRNTIKKMTSQVKT
ncbi:MAG: hypothetical protein ABSF44_15655 [Candidatus Bathyarchaeia archaeon]|jgi:hypothetical protein